MCYRYNWIYNLGLFVILITVRPFLFMSNVLLHFSLFWHNKLTSHLLIGLLVNKAFIWRHSQKYVFNIDVINGCAAERLKT